MTSSVEYIQRSKVFFSACNCAVDVLLVKGPESNQLQVLLYEPVVAISIAPLTLNYFGVVESVNKISQQNRLNVVLDSSQDAVSDIEQLRDVVSKKAVFDYVVGGLQVTYDASKVQIVNIKTNYGCDLGVEPVYPRRSLTTASAQLFSLLGRMFTSGEGEMAPNTPATHISSSAMMATPKAETEPETCQIAVTAEPNKYGDPSGAPAQRLVQHLLKRMNSSSSSSALTEEQRSATTTTRSGSLSRSLSGVSAPCLKSEGADLTADATTSEIACEVTDRGDTVGIRPEDGDPHEESIRAERPQDAALVAVQKGHAPVHCAGFSDISTRSHPAMHKPSFVRKLVVITDLGDYTFPDEFADWGICICQQEKPGEVEEEVVEDKVPNGEGVGEAEGDVQVQRRLSDANRCARALAAAVLLLGGFRVNSDDGAVRVSGGVVDFGQSPEQRLVGAEILDQPGHCAAGSHLQGIHSNSKRVRVKPLSRGTTTCTATATLGGKSTRGMPWWVSAIISRMTNRKNKQATVYAE